MRKGTDGAGVRMVTDSVRSLALLTAVVGAAAALALLLLFVGVGFFGPVNDVLGAVFGVLVVVLAVAMRDLLPSTAALRWLALVAAVVGGVLVVTGAVLVLSGRTGWYLAGLWTSLGWGVLGIWFVVLAAALAGSEGWPMWLRWVGLVGGVLLLAGLAVVPGIRAGIDDWDSAGAALVVPQAAGYLGSLLLLIWCFGVARSGS